jgi:hypothetical protein
MTAVLFPLGRGAMSLFNMKWRRVTVHTIVAEFLRSERHKLRQLPPAELTLIDQPNMNDPSENHARLRYLAEIRRQLIGEIPPDTQWYKVISLTDAELLELHIIGRCGWDNLSDQNQLLSVAARSPEPMNSQPSNWRVPILWGHERTGPFTIIEGNHRLIGYASHGQKSGLSIPVFVGLSNTPCFWHIFDAPQKLVNDFWQ